MKPFVCIPNTGTLHVETSAYLQELSNDPRSHGFAYPQSVPVEDTMNMAVKKFLESDCDTFINIDSDIVPSVNIFDKAELFDILAYPYFLFQPQNNPPFSLCILGKVASMKGIQEVEGVGTGCMIISRQVLEAVKPPFLREWDENGLQTLSSDYYFCKKAREAGFKVYADFDHLCRHFKMVDLLQCMSCFSLAKNSGEASAKPKRKN